MAEADILLRPLEIQWTSMPSMTDRTLKGFKCPSDPEGGDWPELPHRLHRFQEFGEEFGLRIWTGSVGLEKGDRVAHFNVVAKSRCKEATQLFVDDVFSEDGQVLAAGPFMCAWA